MKVVNRCLVTTTLILLGCAAVLLTGCGRDAPLANAQNAEIIRQEFQFGGGGGGGGVSPLEDPNRTAQWATLKGVFKINGQPPSPLPLNITKDQAVCGKGGNSVQIVKVGPNNGLQDVLIFLDTPLPVNDADDAEPVWVHSSYSIANNPALKMLEYDQKNCVFLHRVFAMRADQTLKILNSDPVLHNTKLDTKKASGLNESIAALSFTNYEPKYEEKEPFSVSCSVHPWMAAYMITRDSPYFAVTDTDGGFEIKNVPAGVPLEFRVWHEGTKWVSPSSATGVAADWSRGRFEVTLNADETKEIEIVIDASAF